MLGKDGGFLLPLSSQASLLRVACLPGHCSHIYAAEEYLKVRSWLPRELPVPPPQRVGPRMAYSDDEEALPPANRRRRRC